MNTTHEQGQHRPFDRDEAKLVLKAVLQRYGLKHPNEREGGKTSKFTSLHARRLFRQSDNLSSTEMPTDPTNRTSPSQAASPDAPPLDFEWRAASASANAPQQSTRPSAPRSPGFAGISSAWSGDDEFIFHFLIRVAECAVTLHCQVIADNELVATERVKQIRNLTYCRQVSAEDLAKLMPRERAARAFGENV